MVVGQIRTRYENITPHDISELTELEYEGELNADTEVISIQKPYTPEGEVGLFAMPSLPSIDLI